MDNIAEQCEEIEALKAIYDDNWKVETATNSYSMHINSDIKLDINLTEDYPSNGPPNFELLAPTLTANQKQQISTEFRQIYKDNLGGPILFQWIEKLKEIAEDNTVQLDNAHVDVCDKPVIYEAHKEINFDVTHGDIIQDRKSVFQAHVTKVSSLEDTKDFINYLLENKKIAQATHNISAYRILTSKGSVLQDCDDDGEAHAGGRVLHLLQILDLKNVMVVVSRWYGGIHLGPDRFKHINNAARQVLVKAGYLPS